MRCKAFGVNSVDYLLKPVEPESLERALKKVEGLRGSGQLAQPDLQTLLKQLTDSLRETKAEYPEPDCVAAGRPAVVPRPGAGNAFLCRGQVDLRGVGGQVILC